MASYDTALAMAGLHNYNLTPVSSIVPAAVPVEVVETAPDLGPPGHRVTVVEARSTVAGPGRTTAALGWITGEGPGVFYEAAGDFDETTARREVEKGLAAARTLREWDFTDEGVETTSLMVPEEEPYGTAVVIAVYGRGRPIV